ncbi:MAG: Lrp/AsnC family transcriptional regulator [Desulfobacterales bacterium]|jgi:DNA-binding Lrp family transcriptional regulator
MLTDIEKKVIAAIQGDIPVASNPYGALASQSGMSEASFLSVLADLCKRGVVRRFGATLKHQKSGYAANAMGAWQVSESRIEEVGEIMASQRRISHCYRRNPAPHWPYNLYTMIHAETKSACRQLARSLSAKTGVERYALLFSIRELKKTSMTYFADEDD